MHCFRNILLSFLCIIPRFALSAEVASPWSGQTLRDQVQQELRRDGFSLNRMGYDLDVIPSEDGGWLVVLTPQPSPDSTLIRKLPSLPINLDAATGEVMMVVSRLLKLHAEDPGITSESSDFQEKKAEVFERKSGLPRWKIKIAGITATHIQLERKLAKLQGRSVDEKMRALYSPKNPRSTIKLALGLGAALTFGWAIFYAPFISIVRATCESECDGLGALEIGAWTSTAIGVIGGIGAIWHYSSSTIPVSEATPYWDRDTAERKVEEYNEAIFEGLSLGENFNELKYAEKRWRIKQRQHSSSINLSPQIAMGSLGMRVRF